MSSRADLVSAGFWIVVGAAIASGAWQMDRLESQGVPAFAAPGLVPGLLGVLIVLTALVILIRSLRGRAIEFEHGAPLRGALPALGVCLVFGAGLIGRGVPFWVAAAIYLFAHIVLIEWPRPRWLRAALVALVAAAAIATAFQELFLVRLP